ncbi:MAG: hypothetical protein ACRDQA_23710 [Nocardioidaceae bacterium]
MIGLYAKAGAGVVVAGLGATVTALDDGLITGPEWVGIVVTVLVALGAVWAVPNLPGRVRRYAKAITAGLIAGLGSIATSLTGGSVDAAASLTAVGALIVGAGLTGVAPNAPASVATTPRRAASGESSGGSGVP